MSINALKQEDLPSQILNACLRLNAVEAQPIIVGGWVRDRLMELPIQSSNDIDIEVYHISFESLQQVFAQEPQVTSPKFGVLRLDYADISLPRIERCTGNKYNDFCVQINPFLSFKEAGKRRDFTINAIGWDPLSQKILDPFHGARDIEKRLLKPITEAFMEDSYRILRAAQLIARFNFTPDMKLLEWGAQMSPKNLSQQHIQNTKAILKTAPYTGEALRFLENIRWLDRVMV